MDNLSAVLESLRQSHAAGRLAHAYVIIGSPRGNALALAESFLEFLFCASPVRPCGTCAECRRVKAHAHPDIVWLKPETKGRHITIGPIRNDLNRLIAQSSYGGGWKAGVLLHADRMNDAAASAFLKTLEEPPPRSLLLLLTDAPERLLPTILSRCQRIILHNPPEEPEGEWREAVLDVLRAGWPSTPADRLAAAARLKVILEALKRSVEEQETAARGEGDEEGDEEEDEEDEVADARIAARMIEARASVLRLMVRWHRDVLLCVAGAGKGSLAFPEEEAVLRGQARGLSCPQALDRIRAIEDMARRLDRYLPNETVFAAGFDV